MVRWTPLGLLASSLVDSVVGHGRGLGVAYRVKRGTMSYGILVFALQELMDATMLTCRHDGVLGAI